MLSLRLTLKDRVVHMGSMHTPSTASSRGFIFSGQHARITSCLLTWKSEYAAANTAEGSPCLHEAALVNVLVAAYTTAYAQNHQQLQLQQ